MSNYCVIIILLSIVLFTVGCTDKDTHKSHSFTKVITSDANSKHAKSDESTTSLLPNSWPIPALTPPDGSKPKELEYFVMGFGNNPDIKFSNNNSVMTSADASNEHVWMVGFSYTGTWDEAVIHFRSALDQQVYEEFRFVTDDSPGGGKLDGIVKRPDKSDLEVRISHSHSDELWYIMISDETWSK